MNCNCDDIIIELSPEGQDGRSIHPMGEWSSDTEYRTLDLVSYQGSSYIALKTVPLGTLPTDTEYWMVSALAYALYWGNIQGALSDQTDLKDALDAKADAADVYTKTEADTLLVAKADKADTYTKTEDDALLALKADQATTYTKTETDALLADKANADDVYTKTTTDTLLTAKADADAVYTKTETDALLSGKADVGDSYTKAEDDALLALKADADSVYNKTETDALLSDKADSSAVYTKTEADALLADKANTSDLGALAYVDSVAYDDLTGTPTLGTMAGIDDAPSDGKEYARKNGTWAEVEGGDDKADVIITSASGAVASFSDGADGMPVAGLTVAVEPQQDLHGQPNPYPAGGGKQLIPVTATGTTTSSSVTINTNADGSVTFNGTSSGQPAVFITADGYFKAGSVSQIGKPLALSGTYTLSGSNSSLNLRIDIYDVATGTYVQTGDGTITLDGNYCIRILGSNGINYNNYTVYPMLCLSTAPDPTTFAPYSNICPISGWTGANVMRTGKNLWNASADIKYGSGSCYNIAVGNTLSLADTSSNVSYTVQNGVISVTNTTNWRGISLLFPPLKKGTYTLNYKINSENVEGVKGSIYLVDENYKVLSKVYNNSAYTNSTYTNTLSVTDDNSLFVYSLEGATQITFTVTDMQLELGSTASAYEPYHGTTIPISWQTEAGTVYGGTLNVLTGAMVVDRAMVDLGTLTWTEVATGTTEKYRMRAIIPDIKLVSSSSVVANALCSIYKVGTWNQTFNREDMTIGVSESANRIAVYDSRYDTSTSATAFTTAVTGAQFVYELATPLTYTLTAQQLSTLLGDNNIWSDTGNVSVTYRADTKRYIDGKIAETAMTTRQMIADSATADGKAPKSLSTGDLIIVGDELRKATANIGNGSAITDSNSTTATLADVIKALQ